MENEIMKFEEVMEFLSVGKNTLYALLNSGEIQAFRIGKVWKIPRKSVTAYVEGMLVKKYKHTNITVMVVEMLCRKQYVERL